MSKVYLLDYVAGNVRSLANAIEKVGYTIEWIRSPEDVPKADVGYFNFLSLCLRIKHDLSYCLLFLINHNLETHSSWSWPFRSLHDTILQSRIPSSDTKTH